MPLDEQSRLMLENHRRLGLPPLHKIPVYLIREGIKKAFTEPEKENWEDIFSIENVFIPCSWGNMGIRIYKPNNEANLPIFLFFHGGGWALNNLDTHEGICRMFANRAGCCVISVDYRLAPENKFPAAVDDAYYALEWVYNNADLYNIDRKRIIVGGDSSGGYQAAVLAQMARDRNGPKIIGQVLAYPVTDFLPGTKSYDEYGTGYSLDKDAMIWHWNNYLKGTENVNNPYISPARTKSFKNLPDALILTAEYDILRDEAEGYAESLRKAGNQVILKRYEGVTHGYLLPWKILDKGLEAVQQISDYLADTFSL